MTPTQTREFVPIDLISQTIVSGARMPSDEGIERAVLGLLLIENSATAQEALLTLTPEAFYDQTNALIFSAMLGSQAKNGKVDLYTVGAELKAMGSLATVGGMLYLTGLTQTIGSGVNTDTHVKLLLQMQAARELALVGYTGLRNALDEEKDIADSISIMTDGIEKTSLIGLSKGCMKHISEIVDQSIALAKIRQERYLSGKVTGITTGIAELNKMTNGWQSSELVILAARPAMGKTALALHFALSAAASGTPVCIYSLEMSSTSLTSRLLLSQCNVRPESLRSGRMSQEDWNQTEIARQKITKLPIYIDDKSNVSMRYISTHSRIMARKNKCSMVVIDYLQLTDMRTAEKGRNREQEVAQASKSAKELAKELNIPVLLLAQLSRNVESRGGSKEPILSDLRESGSIEQDADMVIFIHRAEYYDRDREFQDVMLSNGKIVNMSIRGLGKLIVAKNREGATGAVKFCYNPALTHITDFDETPYLTPAVCSASSTVSDRPVSSTSMHYVAPDEFSDNSNNLPF